MPGAFSLLVYDPHAFSYLTCGHCYTLRPVGGQASVSANQHENQRGYGYTLFSLQLQALRHCRDKHAPPTLLERDTDADS